MIAKTFAEIAKFNPYHGRDVRFTGPDGAASFTYAPGKSKAHDLAIAREKERTKKLEQEKKETKKQMTVSQWIKENGKKYKYDDFTIVDENNNIILDDRIIYLGKRSKEYTADWKNMVRGKKIVNERKTKKGIVLTIA